MDNIPQTLKYTQTHEWVARESNDVWTVGITDHAQKLLGDVVFIELPAVGDKVIINKEFGVVESVKAASDLYAPISGEIVAINESLVDHPELINQDAYQQGWIIKIKPQAPEQWEQLLEAQAYSQKIS
ncbi:glycine cleavage system protein GcvH [Candidatus Berkiella aquae]|uniref:Glycine cleavage system H protein n=1 Tax=Candidatus Berkiella aquae TaxID=295108 RepID=A0A0Q9YN82_9GAMM|nr:glycine cleavage system protein GcvH [Candidatus Berkiella aquae]MCS5712563.1 glycine cleavage system protein GcvH [Candidatus Berkiella aquae]